MDWDKEIAMTNYRTPDEYGNPTNTHHSLYNPDGMIFALEKQNVHVQAHCFQHTRTSHVQIHCHTTLTCTNSDATHSLPATM